MEQRVNLSLTKIDYSAPEILFGANYDGYKVDIFSLGVILFIMYKG